MKLVVLRHELAMDRVDFEGVEDSERPLVEKGQRRAHKNAFKLKKLIENFDFIISSPYLRARQTATPFREVYPEAQYEEKIWLTPEADPTRALDHLSEYKDKVVLVTSHEPFCGFFCSQALSAEASSFFNFKKGALVCMEFPFQVRKGEAYLRWMLTASILKKI